MVITNKIYKIKGSINTNIVLISDIHYCGKKDIYQLNKVLKRIDKLNPNYICITGDIIDKFKVPDFDLFVEWLKSLANICKVMIVLGNHEFYINRKNQEFGLNRLYINQIKKINNVYLLENKNIVIDNINFIGIMTPIEYYMEFGESKEILKKSLKKITTKKDCYNILLFHSPIRIIEEEIIKELNVDLILCGHTHGGIVPFYLRFLLGNIGLISPNKKLFPKNVYGYKNKYGKSIIITSGIKTFSNKKLSFLNNLFSSEIVNIKVQKK